MDPTLGGRFQTIDPLAERIPEVSPYAYCLNNPVKYLDPDGRWSVSNHHLMTAKGLTGFGITGNQAFLLAYYASVYADNPGRHIIFNNIAHPNYMVNYLSNVDHSGTSDSQMISWQPGDIGMNNNIRHAMRSNWEAKAYENGLQGGISQNAAQLRGMKYGWDNIFSSAQKGHLANFEVNSSGIQEFGIGIHALQDGYGHAGVSMKEHSLSKDVFGNMDSSQRISESAITVHKLMSGDWSNLNGNFDIDMTGMSTSQKQQVFQRIYEFANQ